MGESTFYFVVVVIRTTDIRILGAYIVKDKALYSSADAAHHAAITRRWSAI